MKKIYFLSLLFLASCQYTLNQQFSSVHVEDVDRFWTAYDLIKAEPDSLKQIKLIQTLYFDQGTPGLKALIDKRKYTAEAYVEAINQFPKFWNSVRANTLKCVHYADDIETNIDKLKKVYPDLKPSSVYFTIGAMRTGGQAHKGHVLIGSELALADSNVICSELQPDILRENLCSYFHSNPIDDVVLLNVHEYVHTQQGDYGEDLLSMAVFEGVAEFVSCLAAEKPSVVPAIAYGKEHAVRVRDRFEKEMFSLHWNDWLYNDFENEFGVRDLGYYVGYAICESFYEQADDKAAAIKEMIELDCADHKAVKDFVAKSGYLSKDCDSLRKIYLEEKPSCLLYTSPSPRDATLSRMPSSA